VTAPPPPADQPAGAPDGALVHNLHDGPDLPPEIAAGRRAAEAARRVVAGIAASQADPATLLEVATGLDRLADALDPHRSTSRYSATPGLHGGVTADPRVWESHPFIGPGHPLAPPMRVVRVGDRAVGTVTFGHVYEGPPGAVHGGMVAAMFDLVLGAASSFTEQPGLTGTLTVRYRRPTPIDRPIRYEAWVDRVEERKVLVAGSSWSDDTLLAEGEGIFVRVDRTRYDPPPGA